MNYKVASVRPLQLKTVVLLLTRHGCDGGTSDLWCCFPPPGLSQPVPLVPLSEDNEDAMEKRSFQKLLRKLGLRGPANEQVLFDTVCHKSPRL